MNTLSGSERALFDSNFGGGPLTAKSCPFIKVAVLLNFTPLTLVNVKWNTQRLNDIEVNTDSSPQEFKAMLFSLTGVPPDRQKVLMSGGVLGDTSYDKLKLRNVIIFVFIPYCFIRAQMSY